MIIVQAAAQNIVIVALLYTFDQLNIHCYFRA